MSRIHLVVTFTLAVVCVLILAPDRSLGSQSPPSFGDWCKIEVRGETRNRHVFGPVSSECGNCFGHTAPFGNWGANSTFGPLQDSDQFKGWAVFNANCYEHMDDPEWNSCTANFPAPSISYYNWPWGVGDTQMSGDIVSLGTQIDWFSTTEENGCEILNDTPYDVYSTLQLYEIDPWTSDEHIMNLTFPSSAINLSCNREGCSQAAGSWVTSSSNSVVSAEFRIVIQDSCHWIEGKGC